MWRSGLPVDAPFRADLWVAVCLLLLKTVVLSLTAQPLAAGSDQFVATDNWLPDALVSIYPVYQIIVGSLGEVHYTFAMQTIASTATAWLLYLLARRELGLSGRHALLIATIVALDPAQLAAERTALPDVLSRLLVVWMLFAATQHLRRRRLGWALGWLAAGAMLAMLDPALGWVVMFFALCVPFFMWLQSFPAFQAAPLFAMPRMHWLRMVSLLVFGALLAQSLAAVNARMIGPWDTAVQDAGAQRLAAWAPLLSPASTRKVDVDFNALQTGEHRLTRYAERAHHLYDAEGLWTTVRRFANEHSLEPHRLARKLAARGMQAQPQSLVTVVRESVWPSDLDLDHGTAGTGGGRRAYSLILAVSMLVTMFWVGLRWRRRAEFIVPGFAALIQCALAMQLFLLNPDISLAKSAWLSVFSLPLALLGPGAKSDSTGRERNCPASTGAALWRRGWAALTADNGPIRFGWLVVVSSVVFVSLSLGQDRNWDMLNYHLYNPLAWWEGRPLDVVPAQLQSWYSPFLDLPTFLLARTGLHGAWLSIWLAVPTMLALWIVWRMVVAHTAHLAVADRWSFAALAMVLLLTSSAGGVSIGATFNEWPIAAAMMVALYRLVRLAGLREVRYRHLVAPALVAGAAAGLKLTALPNCVALGAAVTVALPAGQRARGLLVFGMSGLVGGLMTLGPWAVHVWQETGNPLFPYYNQWFQSPDAEPISYVFALYRPESWWEAVASPWHLAIGERWFSELPTADARLLLGWLAACVVLLRQWRNKAAITAFDKQETVLVVFFVVSYVGWLALHAIHRYTIGLELAAILLLIIGLARWRAVGLTVGVVLMTLLQLVTVLPDWGRNGYTRPIAYSAHQRYPAGSVLASFGGAPVGYVAVGLPAEVPLLGLSNNLVSTTVCRRWQRDGLQALQSAKHLWTVQSDAVATADELAASEAYGVRIGSPCHRVQSTLQPFWLCPAQFDPSRANICASDSDSTPIH